MGHLSPWWVVQLACKPNLLVPNPISASSSMLLSFAPNVHWIYVIDVVPLVRKHVDELVVRFVGSLVELVPSPPPIPTNLPHGIRIGYDTVSLIAELMP